MTKRPPGRPPLDAHDPHTAQLCVTLPSKQFDELYRHAHRERISMAEVVRRALAADKKISKIGHERP